MLNAQPQSYYDNLEDGELSQYSSREFTGHKDFYFRLMYLRLVRALDYLVTLPQWDGKRVAIYGESQGGAQTAFLAGIDPRVTAAVLRVPAFVDVAGPLDGRRGSWPQTYGYKAKELEDSIPYYDGACLLSLAKAKLFFEAGLVDYTCPPGCVAAGFNNAPSKDKTIVFFPYRAHTHNRMDKRSIPIWQKEIMTPREKWLNDYLK
jgi:cephalosporin-C deacetylase-like acetyl esterase